MCSNFDIQQIHQRGPNSFEHTAQALHLNLVTHDPRLLQKFPNDGYLITKFSQFQFPTQPSFDNVNNLGFPKQATKGSAVRFSLVLCCHTNKTARFPGVYLCSTSVSMSSTYPTARPAFLPRAALISPSLCPKIPIG
jgi:hypothetical protein